MNQPRFGVSAAPLAGLRVITRRPLEDERGFMCRFFCAQELAAAGFVKPVAHINHSFTAAAGTVRGLHFQRPPEAECKLVSCARGEVFSVALDLRRGSPTFLRWHGERLSAANCRSLLVPEGFAHGIQALTDGAELIYVTSHPYAPAAAGGVSPLDPAAGIKWPLPVTGLSAADKSRPFLSGFGGLDIAV